MKGLDMTRRTIFLLLVSCAIMAAADLTGSWALEVQTAAGTGNPAFVFKQEGEKLTGTYRGLLGEAAVTGMVRGNAVEFEFKASYEGQAIEAKYKGVVESADSMKGTVVFTGLGDGAWTGKRNK
jgi:hypothetical protein